MLRVFILILSLLAAPITILAQWEEYYSYNGIIYGGVCADGAYVGNSRAFYKYNTEDFTISKFSKNNCLTSIGISQVKYADGLFFVGYTDGGIDIVDEETLSTRTISDLRDADHINLKTISSFYKHGSKLYCTFESGLLEINTLKNETKSYYKMLEQAPRANDVVVYNDSLYVATSEGLLVASATSGILEDVKQWKRVAGSTSAYIKLTIINGKLYAISGSAGNTCTMYQILSNDKVKKIRSISKYRGVSTKKNNVVFASQTSIAISDTSDIKVNKSTISKYSITIDGEISEVTPNIRSISFITDEVMVCADATRGMVIVDVDGNAERHNPNGPANAYAFELKHSNGVLYASYGGLDPAYNNLSRTAGVHIYKDGEWNSYTTTGRDLTRLCADPNRPDSVYVSAWGTGILKLSPEGFVVRYDEYNSSLEDIFNPGKGYNRCGAIAYDNDGNLYVGNASVAIGIKVKLADGTWTKGLSYVPTNTLHSTTRMVCTSNGNMWLTIPRTDFMGLMVFNVNGTPEDDSDDTYRCTGDVVNKDGGFLGRLPLVDQDGDGLPTLFNEVVEDKNGVIWMGTADGIYRCSQNDIILKDVSKVQYFEHVKVPRNDGSNLADYLLGGVNVTNILVDSENRKWVGTEMSGLYLISADGMQTIKHFTAENSPLPSNQINSLAMDESTGKLYISAGSYGIVSYQTDAKTETKSSEEDIDLKIYPNPVLPTFVGDVTIEGLPSEVDVRISDVQGRLVYSGKPVNGTLYWNLSRFGYGPRVATGVYLVWVQTLDGKQKAVGKIAVVK